MDNAGIEELFEGLGPVSIRRMFGGKGIYHQGLIVAIDLRDEIMLKADSTSASAFEAAGARQWSYEGRNGRPVLMPYWSIPERAFDDPDEMRIWVTMAFEAAMRGNRGR
jgi:DNA transformation protein and related proteins